MLEFFYEQLKNYEVNLQQSQKNWDNRASEVSQFKTDLNDPFFKLLRDKMTLKDLSVLDLGFGGGRHLTTFLKEGARIHGIELSERMHDYAIQNLNRTGIPYDPSQLIVSPLQKLDLQTQQWSEAFDLVYTHMGPIIESKNSLDKVLQASKRYVLLVSYGYREDELLRDLQDELNRPKRSLGSGSYFNLYHIYNILYLEGFFPEMHTEHRVKESEHSISHIFERYGSWLFKSEFEEESNKQLLLKALNKRELNGVVKTKSNEVVNYLFLDKTIKGQPFSVYQNSQTNYG